ncbi:hypothetical protein V6N12_054016 [Hibiscus sabdariffa]|uniref:Uncharacterized protein n=1 Tax=Hibiscus sabdariffa TaxID=183260 RepID=A0ABR2D9A7_9ROSI
MIKDEYCLCHLATGDMLRVVVAAKTPLDVKAKEAMDKGEVFPISHLLRAMVVFSMDGYNKHTFIGLWLANASAYVVLRK